MGTLLNDQALRSFAHEVEVLEKISAIPGLRFAGMAGRGAGSLLSRGLGGIGRGVLETPQALRETGSMLSHPLQSLKKGWEGSTWMGKGKVTRYLPVGQKTLALGFASPGMYEAYKATKETPTPTMEGGTAERALGEVGGGLGFVSGLASKRFLPSMLLMGGGYMAGGKLGRIIDRLRGGASIGTAVSAPSPTEAEGQLQDIQRYYG
mgnify:CR=1 FL=1